MIEGRYQNLTIDGLSLRLFDAGGRGLPVVFQHGLCGDSRQTREAFPADPRFRLITLECRGHGESEAGEPAQFSLQTFAHDVQAAVKHLGISRYAVGGISMGAALALKIAAESPTGLAGVMSVRPAWTVGPLATTLRPNALVGHLIAEFGDVDGLAVFKRSATFAQLAQDGPDNLASLQGFFSRAPLSLTSELLQRIATDWLGLSAEDLHMIQMPSLVIGHDRDVIHPLALARQLAGLLPRNTFCEITPKVTNKTRYLADMHSALSQFMETLL